MEENKIESVAPVAAEKKDSYTPRPHNQRAAGANGDRPQRKTDRKGGRPQFKREREEKKYEERVVQINRISKTVKGGRRMRFSALVVIGDGKGKYGFGTGKAQEVPDAIKKALTEAANNMFHLPMVKGATIPHEIIGKYGACRVYLKPALDGTGIIAGGPVRAILELAGVQNIYSKVYGSRTPINIIRATVSGLNNLKTFAKVKALRK